jgi:hypothetical protein
LNITKHKEREQEQDLNLKTKCLNVWQMPPFIGKKFKTIDLMTNYWVGGHLLTTTIIFLSEQNIIVNVIIWTDSLHESSGHLSQLSNKIRMSSFGLLEHKIGLNTEQYLGCRTNSDISFVVTIWSWKRPFWILDSSWKF